MKSTEMKKEEIKIVGLKVRTNNRNEFNPESSKISVLVNEYYQKQLAEKVKHRSSPNKTYSIYTEYDSDEHGDYSYFVGEAVSDFSEQDLQTFSCLTIPAQQYQCFTTERGEIPKIIIEAWQEIWHMSELKGQRNYVADFEILDERCANPSDAEVDIYIGIN